MSASTGVDAAVVAPQFRLVDDAGSVRATLEASPQGGASLTFTDGLGRDRLKLLVNSDGWPGLGLVDQRGEISVLVAHMHDGSRGMSLADNYGGVRAALGGRLRRAVLPTGRPKEGFDQWLKERPEARRALTMRFHDLRHSAASLLRAQGADLREIMEVLGHSQISTPADIYTHVFEAAKRGLADRMDAAFRGSSGAVG